MTNLLKHNAQSAVIQLGQSELLLLMALVKEGIDSFGCNNSLGKSLDQFLVSTNITVEEARRKALPRINMAKLPDRQTLLFSGQASTKV